MNTSQATLFLSEVLKGSHVTPRAIGYFRARLKNRLHDLILSTFLALEAGQRISKATLAKRLNRKPEQITRWLGAPGNWELDTVSDLLVGMGYELQIAVSAIASRETADLPMTTKQLRAADTPAWLTALAERTLAASSSLLEGRPKDEIKESVEIVTETKRVPLMTSIQLSGANEPIRHGAFELVRRNRSQYQEART